VDRNQRVLLIYNELSTTSMEIQKLLLAVATTAIRVIVTATPTITGPARRQERNDHPRHLLIILMIQRRSQKRILPLM